MLGAVIGSAVIGAAGSYLEGKKAAEGYEKGQKASLALGRENLDFQKEVYEQQREDIQPWREAGESALTELNDMIRFNDIDPGEFKFEFNQDDPSYQFRFNEGLKAIENRASARGNAMSGAQMKGLQRYGQGMASQEYQNEFARDLTEYNTQGNRIRDIYNRLAGVAGTGKQAANTMIGAGGAMAGRAGNIMQGMGSTSFQGEVGQGNAMAGIYGGAAQAANQGIGNYMLWDAYKTG